MDLLIQLIVTGLINAVIFSLIGIGFGIVYRTTHVFHIVYGGLYISAAYFLYLFRIVVGLPMAVSIFFSLVGTCFVGFIIEVVIYRPFFRRKAGSGVVLIASLGAFIFIENLISMIFGNEVKIVTMGIEPSYQYGKLFVTRIQVIQLVTGLGMILVFFVGIKTLKFFKAIWAMGDTPDLIPILGLPLYKIRTAVFVVSAIFVGSASILTALDVGMDPHMGMAALLTGAVAVIVGGVDRFWGWVAGGFVLAELQSLVIWKFSANWMNTVTFLLLITILLIRPQGILGTKKRLEEN